MKLLPLSATEAELQCEQVQRRIGHVFSVATDRRLKLQEELSYFTFVLNFHRLIGFVHSFLQLLENLANKIIVKLSRERKRGKCIMEEMKA